MVSLPRQRARPMWRDSPRITGWSPKRGGSGTMRLPCISANGRDARSRRAIALSSFASSLGVRWIERDVARFFTGEESAKLLHHHAHPILLRDRDRRFRGNKFSFSHDIHDVIG